MKYTHTKKQWIKWYEQKRQLMGEAYTEVTPQEFYRDMFPEGSLQVRGDMENDRGNAMVDIITYYPNEKRFSRKYVMTEDLEALRYMKPQGNTKELSRMCLCSPVSYYGVHKNNNMAHREKGKRLKQRDHLELARMSRDIRQRGSGTKWTDNNGRPDVSKIVEDWRKANPDGKKADCIRDTGLSKPTVYRWWK